MHTTPLTDEAVRATAYQISRQDYLASGKLYAKPTTKTWLITAALIAIVLVLFWIGSGSVYPVIGGIIGGLLMALLVSVVLNPWLLSRQYRRHPLIREPQAVALTPEGVRFSAEYGESLLRWSYIHQWRHNDQYLLIYQSPRVFHVIPKRIAEDGFDMTTFNRPAD